MISVGQLCALFGIFGAVGLALIALPDYGGARNAIALIAVGAVVAWVVGADGWRKANIKPAAAAVAGEAEERQD